jgi:Uma2 family endonuclease
MNELVAAKAGRATYQDVLDAPEHMVAELIKGALHLQPRPASPHARAASMLTVEVGGPFDRGRGGPGGWWIVAEPEVHLGEDVLVPDLAGWRRERMPAYPAVPYFVMAPDWICEVLSPGARRIDLTEKRPIYGTAGVGHLWFVDPIDRTLEVFAWRDGAWSLVTALRDDAEVKAAPFEAVGFPLSALWAG